MYKKIFSVFVFCLIISMSFVLAAQGNGVGNQEAIQNQDTTNQQAIQTRARVMDGTHMTEDGKMIRVQNQANNRIRLEAEGVSADCACNLTQEQIQNRTRLNAKLSNGRNAEIKIMPNTASERALERLRLRVCSEENNCSIELKEVGEGEQAKLAYEMKVQKQSKFLGLFRKRMQVKAQIDSETGEVIRTKKPWWAFLASEPEEVEETEE